MVCRQFISSIYKSFFSSFGYSFIIFVNQILGRTLKGRVIELCISENLNSVLRVVWAYSKMRNVYQEI